MSEKTSLYRRRRPLSFAEVVGQEHVVRTLKGAVESGNVHHAYLFVGSRGTGKTSMAKILARSLNCVNGPTATPCGECDACVSVAAGNSLDVIEMDAASNRSVDDIRELRERVGYAPAAGHWKVYILDEAHMLTKEAWNAFLKTLEEPPPNTVFVLATTEPQKVMATIVDRCQRFDFQRPSLDQIGEVLKRAADAEGFEVEDGAAALISRSASGSFRDALGTLDQLVAYGGPKVATDDVITVLGAADADLLFGSVDAIAAGDAAAALATVERLAQSGRDPATYTRDLIAHLRQLIVVKLTGNLPDSFSVTISDPDRLRDQATGVPEASIIAAIDTLSAALAAIREGDDPRLSLEVALLKVARPSLDSSRDALLRRIERLEGGALGGGGEAASGRKSPAPPAASEPQRDALHVPEPVSPPPPVEPGQDAVEPVAAAAPAEADASPEPVGMDTVVQMWEAVIEHVRDSGADVLSSVFDGARPLAIEGEKLRIGFPDGSTFNKRTAEVKANVERFAESLDAITGRKLRPVYEMLAAEQEVEVKAVSEEDMVDLIKTTFDAHEVDDEQRRAEG